MACKCPAAEKGSTYMSSVDILCIYLPRYLLKYLLREVYMGAHAKSACQA